MFLSLKNDVSVASKSNKQKNGRNIFFSCHLEDHCGKQQDPDPFVGGTGLQIWIRTKMSQICNTACRTCLLYPTLRTYQTLELPKYPKKGGSKVHQSGPLLLSNQGLFAF
jgi:hypothetical protein